MHARRLTVSDVVALLAMVLPSLLIGGVFLPQLEMSRGEARAVQAWIDVQRLRAAAAKQALAVELPQKDPWGQAYQRITLTNGRTVFLSCGPNQITRANSLDADDITSDMITSPAEPFRHRRKRQFLLSGLIAIGAWFVLATFYWRKCAPGTP